MNPTLTIKKSFSLLSGVVFLFISLILISCGGEDLTSTPEIVCEAYIQCENSEMTMDECIDMPIKRFGDFPDNFQDTPLYDIERGEDFNDCLKNYDVCERIKTETWDLCFEHDEFKTTSVE